MSDVASLWRSHQEQRKKDVSIPSDNPKESSRIRRITTTNLDTYDLLLKWPRLSEKIIFALGFGGQVMAAATSALSISMIIRKRFFISGDASGFMSAYGATAVASGLALAGNDQITIRNLFYTSEKDPTCFTCMQSRQALANLGASLLVPTIMVITETMYHAARDPGYGAEVPLVGQWKRIWKFVAEKMRGKVMRQLSLIGLANVLVTYVGTYLEFKAVDRILTLIEDDPTLLPKVINKEGLFSRIMGKMKGN